jgi:hypothetical protein
VNRLYAAVLGVAAAVGGYVLGYRAAKQAVQRELQTSLQEALAGGLQAPQEGMDSGTPRLDMLYGDDDDQEGDQE